MLSFFRRKPDLKTLLALCSKFQQERDDARAIAERQLATIARLRLELSLKPDPLHRMRRMAQLSPIAQTRYLRNIAAIGTADVSTLTKGTGNGS